MADRTFENFGEMEGSYAGTPFEESRSSVVSVTLADVPFTKEANQSIWFSGELTLTFTIDNTDGEGELAGIVITDTLDITCFAYIANSVVVAINGTPTTAFTVDYTAPLLTITLTNAIAVGQVVTISFRGAKVPA